MEANGCTTQKLALNSLFFRQFFSIHSNVNVDCDYEMGHIMLVICMCTHNICQNQNVLFIDVLLRKLMLKYFIAEHCEIVDKCIRTQKYLENFHFTFFAQDLLEMSTICFCLEKFCLLSIKQLEASSVVFCFL